MAYERVFKHFDADHQLVGSIDSEVVAGARFTLRRYGGCAEGQITLRRVFTDRTAFEPGHWISFEFDSSGSSRWYYGRIEQRRTLSPAGVTLSLMGMGVQLYQVFVGDFRVPIVYGRSDVQFPDDPDAGDESFVPGAQIGQVVQRILDDHVLPATDITYASDGIDAISVAMRHAKFAGEEHVVDVFKQLALWSGDANWGVDADGQFFFQQKNAEVQGTVQEGVDAVRLEETRDIDLLFNRVLFIGGWIYRSFDGPPPIRYASRFRRHFKRQSSIDVWGQRRLRIDAPWIRTTPDASAFVSAFFDTYAQPVNVYEVQVEDRAALWQPWDGPIRLKDADGNTLSEQHPQEIEVLFDERPAFLFRLGPEDPLSLWPNQNWDLREPVPFPEDRDDSSSGVSGTGMSTGTGATSSGLGSSSSVPSGSSASGLSGSSGVGSSGADSTTGGPGSDTSSLGSSSWAASSSGPGCSNSISDDFNRTDEDPLDTSIWYPWWNEPRVQGNRVVVHYDGGGDSAWAGYAIHKTQLCSTDMQVNIDSVTDNLVGGNITEASLLARCQSPTDSTDRYRAAGFGDGSMVIQKIINSVQTTIASDSWTEIEGDYQFECDGNTLTLTISPDGGGGDDVLQTTNSDITTGFYAGFNLGYSTGDTTGGYVSADDFTAQTI